MRITLFLISFFIIFPLLIQASPNEKEILFYDDFRDLADWRPVYFSNKKNHTEYTIVQEGNKTFLKAVSSASASALLHKREFSVHEYPGLRWKWRVENIYQKGDVTKKAGDDYPIRVYVVFKYNPDRASFGQKIKYGLARKIYGEYPPQSSLLYIWANRKDEKGIVSNPYSPEAKMVIRQAGPDKIGSWQEEDVNIVDDYKKAFGSVPPDAASIAVMNDSDNTGESAVSYIEFIEVYKIKKPPEKGVVKE